MSTRSLHLSLALGLAFPLAPAAAQNRPKIPEPKVERAWEEDAAGLRQWQAFEVVCTHCKGAKTHVCEHCKDAAYPICLECDGTKRATCRTCAGIGSMPDPLVELACPYCWGSSWYTCGQCNGFGKIQVDNVDTKCGACKEQGLLACTACKGKRRVAVATVGRKGPGEASAADLRETRALFAETLTALQAYEPDKNPSKSLKEFAKVVAPAAKDLKVIKDMQSLLESSIKGLRSYGAGYVSYEERLMFQFLVFKDRTVYLLQYQLGLFDVCLERADFNEKVKSTSEVQR